MSQRRSVSHGNERGGMSNAGSPRPENEMTHNNYPDDEDFDVRPSEVGKKRKRKSSVQKRMTASTATNLEASTIAMATTSTPTRTIQSKDQESNIGPSPTLAPLKDDMTEQLAIATERLRLANSELQSGRQRLKSERRNLARRIERLDRLLQETADMFPNTQDKLKKTEPQSKIEEKHIFGKTTVSRYVFLFLVEFYFLLCCSDHL